jgi:outer membrane protein OmpA-like peptidoglycan-associated protein
LKSEPDPEPIPEQPPEEPADRGSVRQTHRQKQGMFAMRINGVIRLALLGMVVATTAGCSNKPGKEAALLQDENAQLRQQLADRNAALEAAEQARRDKELELARMQREGVPQGETGFEGIEGVTGTVGAGEVTASVSSDVLFDSGKATLKPAAKKSLDAVAEVLKSKYGGYSIRIAGHTDTDPIKRSGHKSNDHLGFERAFAVKQYLISKGVGEKQVSLASFGPNKPAGNKQQSRRVEIVVMLNS